MTRLISLGASKEARQLDMPFCVVQSMSEYEEHAVLNYQGAWGF